MRDREWVVCPISLRVLWDISWKHLESNLGRNMCFFSFANFTMFSHHPHQHRIRMLVRTLHQSSCVHSKLQQSLRMQTPSSVSKRVLGQHRRQVRERAQTLKDVATQWVLLNSIFTSHRPRQQDENASADAPPVITLGLMHSSSLLECRLLLLFRKGCLGSIGGGCVRELRCWKTLQHSEFFSTNCNTDI